MIVGFVLFFPTLLLNLSAADADIPPVHYSIPKGDARDTLLAYGKQSGMSVVFNPDHVRGIVTNEIQAELAPSEALKLMLENTPLGFNQDVDSNAVAVVRKPQNAAEVTLDNPGGHPGNPNHNKPNQHTENRMKNEKRLFGKLLAGLATLAVTATPNAQAQEAEEEADIATLSPFEVSAEDAGYLATTTLAGGRTRASLSDISSQVEVLTLEFLSDVGAMSEEEVFLYSTNVESTYEYAQETGAFGSLNVRNNTRIRGLSTASRTREFFPTRMSLDSYNQQRTTISSGPNSILFGLGSPAGTVDTTLKRPNVRDNFGEIGLRIDSFDGTRGILDYNHALVENKLAVRVALVSAYDRSHLDPNKDFKTGIYGAIAYNPFERTKIRLSYEYRNRSAQRAMGRTPFDAVSPWVEAGMPLFDNSLANVDDNGNGVINGNEIRNALRRDPNGYLFMGGNPDRVDTFRNRDNPVGWNDNTPMVVGGAAASVPIAQWSGRSAYTAPPEPPTQLDEETRAGYGGDDLAFLFQSSLRGFGWYNRNEDRALTAVVEQRLFDKLFVEIAFNQEKLDEIGTAQIGGNNWTWIRGDANMYMPDGITPNPNAGKFFTEGRLQGGRDEIEQRNLRISASYELDFTEHAGWTRWLGRHSLAGIYTNDSTKQWDIGGSRAIVPAGATYLTGSSNDALNNRANELWVRYYFDNPFTDNPNYPSGSNNALAVIGNAGVQQHDHKSGQYTFTDVNGQVFTTGQHQVYDGFGTTGAGGSDKNTLVSWMGVYQGYFWKNRIIPFVGVRHDKAEVWEEDPADRPGRQDNNLFPYGSKDLEASVLTQSASGTSYNYGLVIHPLPWISFHYNQSENFIPPPGNLNAWDEQISGSSGDGKDYGVRFNLLDNKLYFRINKYENTQIASRPANDVNNIRGDLVPFENRARDAAFFEAEDPSNPGTVLQIPNGFDPSIAANGFDPTNGRGANDYRTSQDKVAEGYELEMVINPVSNFSVRFNAANQKSTVSNVALSFRDWTDARVSVWQSVTDTRPYIDADGNGIAEVNPNFGVSGWENLPWNDGELVADGDVSFQEQYETVIIPQMALIAAQDGLSEQQIRDWRVNVFGNYKFTDGKLDGLSLGGGLRYRSAPVLGFGTMENPEDPGEIILNPDDRLKGDSDIFVDFVASYRMNLLENRVRAKFQLNVRNLFDTSDPVAISKFTDGSPASIGLPAPRQFIFTTTFAF